MSGGSVSLPGEGVSLVPGGGGSGTVTKVVTNAAPFLNGGTITGDGTITAATLAATSLIGNAATAGAVPTAIAIGPGLSLATNGTLTATGGGGSDLTVIGGTSGSVTPVSTLTMLGVVASGSTPNGIVNMTTIVGASTGTGSGVGILLTGGNSTDPGSFAGGSLYFTGGNGDSGGPVQLLGGSGVFGAPVGMLGGSATSVYGGSFFLEAGGSSNTNGAASVQMNGNLADTSIIYSADASGTIAGQVLELRSGSDNTGLAPGELEINEDSAIIAITHSWNAGENPDGLTIGIASRRLWLKYVVANLDAANAGASTLAPVKAASATAIAAGTALTSDSVDCAGTPAANQSLTITATLADQFIEPGERIGLVTSGVFALSAGNITLWFMPWRVLS